MRDPANPPTRSLHPPPAIAQHDRDVRPVRALLVAHGQPRACHRSQHTPRRHRKVESRERLLYSIELQLLQLAGPPRVPDTCCTSTTRKRALKRIGLVGGVTARASTQHIEPGRRAQRQAGLLLQFARRGDAEPVRHRWLATFRNTVRCAATTACADVEDRRDPLRRRETPGGSA